ncbi:SWI/SNF complex component snf12 [Serendipita sp. 401]|nr:SWI/SNF complex component snf12 [Serendipita sp. 401]
MFVKFVAQGRGRSLNNLLPTTSHHFYKNKMPRRLTDRSLPHGLSAISPDVGLFDELMEMEKRLDWTMTRRRQEMTDVLNRGTLQQTRRTLRIFLSHTVRNQAWQKSAEDDDSQAPKEEAGDSEEAKAAMETAEGVPSWTFKLEGKLLDSDAAPTPKRWPTPERKFSHMLKGVSIEMDRDPNVYADTNHVQWTSNPQWNNYNNLGQFPTAPNPVSATETAPPSLPAGTVPVDGLTVTRLGDAPTALRLTLHLNHSPDRLKVSPQLASIISVYEDTKPNILGAFWHYVKANGLQDKNDRKLIRLDERLRGVFKYETLNFQDIPALLISGQHMAPADPIVLRYELGTHCIETATGGDVDMTSGTGVAAPLPGGIGVDKNGESAITAYDLSLDMDDLWMRSKAADIIMNMQPDSMSHGSTSTASNSGSFVAIQKADDEIKQRLQNLRNLRMRRDFFAGLANEPSAFIQKFVQSQSRDLEVVLGNERAAEGGGSGGNLGRFGVHETDLVKSEFFHGDWAYEAVGVHEALRMGNAVAMFHHMALSQQQQQQQQAQHGPPPNMGAMPPPPGGMQMR